MITFISNAFSIVIFVSFVGSVFSILTTLVKKVLHIALPLWLGICGIMFFFVPFILPVLRLIPPEEQQWIYGYRIACMVWLAGMIFFIIYFCMRSLLAYYALKNYRTCDDGRINRVWLDLVKASGLKKVPVLSFGTLKEPACVVTINQPYVILNEKIMKQLTDEELGIVLCHEITHIKRAHYIYQSVFNLVYIIHWFNPFAWISKYDFALHCEIDCDQKALSQMRGSVNEVEYATAMLRLMELLAIKRKRSGVGLEALGFLLARQRMYYILKIPSRYDRIVGTSVLALFIAITLLLSAYVSRSYFYPYPAYNTGIEYNDTITGK